MRHLALISLLTVVPAVASASTWEAIKKGASETAEAAGGAVSSGARVVGGAASDGAEAVTDAVAPERSREEVDQMAAATLKKLFSQRPDAKPLLDKSFGYAIFDTRKMSFMITTGFGAGVAVERGANKRTYMKMASGGVNIGMGAQWYQVVFMFESPTKFRTFVDEGWDAGASGSAVALKESASLGATYTNGVAVFQLTDKGLMLAADLTGTKYWQDDELNAQ